MIKPIDETFGLDLSIPLEPKQKPGVRPLHPDLPKPPFVMSIAAPRGSGKSFLVRHLLNDDNFYRGVWDPSYIWIMCPSLEFNDDYADLGIPFEDEIHKVSDVNKMIDEVNTLFDRMADCVKEHKQKNTPQVLLILDDILDSPLLNFKGVVDKISCRGRHVHISVILCSQRISGISRTVRLNSDMFLIFAPSNYSEAEQWLLQFVAKKNKKKMEALMEEIFDTPFNFIVLNNQKRRIKDRLRIRFSEIINFDKKE